MREFEELVNQEFGHFFGQVDKGKTFYAGDGGMMVYRWSKNAINDDVNAILNYAKDYLK